MSFFQNLILGLVQGISEFLPISSDGHLTLTQHILKTEPSFSFIVFLHAATFLSILFFFRNKRDYFYSNLKYIIVASIPTVIIGFSFKNQVENLFQDFRFLPIFFLITGLSVFSTKFISKKDQQINYFKAILIGIFQSTALLPGVSRSGTTIFMGLLLGLSPTNAFNFSFALSIPVLAGAIILESKNIVDNSIINPSNLLVFFFTFLIGLLALKFLRKIVASNKFWLFGIYTIILSLVLFLSL